jgi:hypothetical protein
MKTVFAFFAALVLAAAIERPAHADASTVSVDYFYDALAPYGDWVEVEGYGYCFRPTVTMEDADWRPYTEGSWIYTDAGWTWDSEEDFGWATYHYGRWFMIGGHWLWAPGEVWGPAWVSWRSNDEYFGWAPLPPEAAWRPDIGFNVYVDVDYDIGPRWYNFIPVHYLGERRLRRWIEPWQRNVDYMRSTDNYTHITYRSSGDRLTRVFNEGPDYTRYSRVTDTPIRRLTLAETQDVNFRDSKAHFRNRIDQDNFRVIAPTVQRRDRDAAPSVVRARLDRTQINRGWKDLPEEKVSELRRKLETVKSTEKPLKALPATSTTAKSEAVEQIGAGPAATEIKGKDRRPGIEAETAIGATDDSKKGKGKGKDMRAESTEKPGVGAPTTREQVGATTDDSRKGKGKGKDMRAESTEKPAVAAPASEQVGATTDDSRKGKGKGKDTRTGSTEKTSPGDKEELRKAVPISPSEERTRINPNEDQPRKGQPLKPDKLRVEPQDAPPRSQVGPPPGINRPDDNPPGPSRKIKPGDESGNSQRPDLNPKPKMKPDKQNDRPVPPSGIVRPNDNPPGPGARKIAPGELNPSGNSQRPDQVPKMNPQKQDLTPRVAPKQIQPTPEPRNIAPPQPVVVPQPKSTPPPALQQGVPSGKPGKPGATNKTDDDDKKKKKS